MKIRNSISDFQSKSRTSYFKEEKNKVSPVRSFFFPSLPLGLHIITTPVRKQGLNQRFLISLGNSSEEDFTRAGKHTQKKALIRGISNLLSIKGS